MTFFCPLGSCSRWGLALVLALGLGSAIPLAAAPNDSESLDNPIDDRHRETGIARERPGLPARAQLRGEKAPSASAPATPLHWASAAGTRADVYQVLQSGADPNARDTMFGGQTPLHWAAKSDNAGNALLLIDEGAHVDLVDDSGYTPLYLSLSTSDSQWWTLLALLMYGANPHGFHPFGDTPLNKAVSKFDDDAYWATFYLLYFGANPNVPAPNGETPIFRAVETELEQGSIRLLRSYGANPSMPGGFFAATPLHVATFEDSADPVWALTDSSSHLGPPADVNARDNRGATPLHWVSGFVVGAAEGPAALRIARALLAVGASVNLRTPDGETALGIAVRNGYVDIAEELRSKGGVH